MSFLKKLGQVIAKGVTYIARYEGILREFVPNAVPVVDTAKRDLLKLADIVVDVESIGAALTLTGPQKLIGAVPGVRSLILETYAGKKVKDQALFEKALTGYAQATADLLNSFDEHEITD